MLSGVRRIPPGTLVTWDRGSQPRLHSIHQLNFDDRKQEDSSTALIDELRWLFIESCKARVDTGRTAVLALSGGLDSRTVAAGLLQTGRPFQSVTWKDSGSRASRDVDVARTLANGMKLPWRLLGCPPATGRDVAKLLTVKRGMISVGQAFDVWLSKQLRGVFGDSLVYFSGDGGDKVLPDLTPPVGLRSVSHLGRYMIATNALMPTELVSRLLSLPVSQIKESIEELVSSYPEQSLKMKYVHSIIHERGMHWLFEGEDHNRCSFWCAAPLYGLPFFLRIMRVSPEQKRRHRLYRAFLESLSPEAAGIIYSNRGVAISSRAFSRKMALVSLANRHPTVSRTLKHLLRPAQTYSANSPIVRWVNCQMRASDALTTVFDRKSLEHVYLHPQTLSHESLQNLFGATSFLCHLTGVDDCLSQFEAVEFD